MNHYKLSDTKQVIHEETNRFTELKAQKGRKLSKKLFKNECQVFEVRKRLIQGIALSTTTNLQNVHSWPCNL